MHVWNSEECYRRTYLHGRNRDANVDNGQVDRERWGRDKLGDCD